MISAFGSFNEDDNSSLTNSEALHLSIFRWGTLFASLMAFWQLSESFLTLISPLATNPASRPDCEDWCQWPLLSTATAAYIHPTPVDVELSNQCDMLVHWHCTAFTVSPCLTVCLGVIYPLKGGRRHCILDVKVIVGSLTYLASVN